MKGSGKELFSKNSVWEAVATVTLTTSPYIQPGANRDFRCFEAKTEESEKAGSYQE